MLRGQARQSYLHRLQIWHQARHLLHLTAVKGLEYLLRLRFRHHKINQFVYFSTSS